MCYGLPLNEDGDDKCLSMLNAVEETICRQLRACKAPSSKRRVLEGRYSTDQYFHFLFSDFLWMKDYCNIRNERRMLSHIEYIKGKIWVLAIFKLMF